MKNIFIFFSSKWNSYFSKTWLNNYVFQNMIKYIFFPRKIFFDTYCSLWGTSWQSTVRKWSLNYNLSCFWMANILPLFFYDSTNINYFWYSSLKKYICSEPRYSHPDFIFAFSRVCFVLACVLLHTECMPSPLTQRKVVFRFGCHLGDDKGLKQDAVVFHVLGIVHNIVKLRPTFIVSNFKSLQ